MIEESEVDPKNKTMITRTKNLNHVRVMQIEETQIFKQHDQNPDWTSCKTEARIISRFGWGLTSKIEGFGQSTFIANAAKVYIYIYCIVLIYMTQLSLNRLVKECNISFNVFVTSKPREFPSCTNNNNKLSKKDQSTIL